MFVRYSVSCNVLRKSGNIIKNNRKEVKRKIFYRFGRRLEMMSIFFNILFCRRETRDVG